MRQESSIVRPPERGAGWVGFTRTPGDQTDVAASRREHQSRS